MTESGATVDLIALAKASATKVYVVSCASTVEDNDYANRGVFVSFEAAARLICKIEECAETDIGWQQHNGLDGKISWTAEWRTDGSSEWKHVWFVEEFAVQL